MPGARDALARIHKRYRVVIFTTRVNPGQHGGEEQLAGVETWLAEHGFVKGEHYDEVTHEKVPALVYIDDRALHFVDWEQALAELGKRCTIAVEPAARFGPDSCHPRAIEVADPT